MRMPFLPSRPISFICAASLGHNLDVAINGDGEADVRAKNSPPDKRLAEYPRTQPVTTGSCQRNVAKFCGHAACKL